MSDEPEQTQADETAAEQPEEQLEQPAAEAASDAEEVQAEAGQAESESMDAEEAAEAEQPEMAAEEAEQPEMDAEDAGQPEAAAEEAVRQPQLKRLIGRKVGMTQVFDETGAAFPVTLIEAGPCYVTQIRNHRRDGYTAVQLGFGEVKPKRLTSGQLGHLKRNDLPALRHLKEFRLRKLGELAEGDKLTVSVFEVGDMVDVVGTSKGRGFAGAIKRHGFRRQPKTHGQSDRERAPGSQGSTSTPGRVFKGMRGPGHMGSHRVSAQHLQVHLVDPEHNLLGVGGSIPGPNGGLVLVKEGRKQ